MCLLCWLFWIGLVFSFEWSCVMMHLEIVLRQVASIHSSASLGFGTGTHQSLLATQDILTEIIEEQNEKYNRASSGTGVCPFQVFSYQASKTQRNCGGGTIKVWSHIGRTKYEQRSGPQCVFWRGPEVSKKKICYSLCKCSLFFFLFLLKVLHLSRWEWSKLFNS